MRWSVFVEEAGGVAGRGIPLEAPVMMIVLDDIFFASCLVLLDENTKLRCSGSALTIMLALPRDVCMCFPRYICIPTSSTLTYVSSVKPSNDLKDVSSTNHRSMRDKRRRFNVLIHPKLRRT